jgi:hypothetical protein
MSKANATNTSKASDRHVSAKLDAHGHPKFWSTHQKVQAELEALIAKASGTPAERFVVVMRHLQSICIDLITATGASAELAADGAPGVGTRLRKLTNRYSHAADLMQELAAWSERVAEEIQAETVETLTSVFLHELDLCEATLPDLQAAVARGRSGQTESAVADLLQAASDVALFATRAKKEVRR